jgi:hypothetical protein
MRKKKWGFLKRRSNQSRRSPLKNVGDGEEVELLGTPFGD